MHARVAVGGRTEQIALLVETNAPGVVACTPQELEFRAVRLEAVEALAKSVLLLADGAVEARVTDDAVDPVVQAVLQVTRAGMRVAGVPAAEENLALISHVVAVGVSEEQRVRRLVNDHPAAGEDQARGNAQLVGEDRNPVGLALALGIFQYQDAIATL